MVSMHAKLRSSQSWSLKAHTILLKLLIAGMLTEAMTDMMMP